MNRMMLSIGRKIYYIYLYKINVIPVSKIKLLFNQIFIYYKKENILITKLIILGK